MLLKDKVAVITGGGSGVGLASATLFAQQGARVVIGELRDEWARETVRLVAGLGGTITYVQTDVTREDQVQRLVKAAVDTYGTLDIMFNNVGVATPRPPRPTWEYTDADWDRLMNTNLRSVFYGCKHAIPLLIAKRSGVILNTGSVAGMVAWGGVPYGVSKAGVIQLTKGLAIELAPYGIRVNCISPGAIDTNFARMGPPLPPDQAAKGRAQTIQSIPLGRISRPEDIAQAALYLASEMSSYVTGSVLVVDGGYTAR